MSLLLACLPWLRGEQCATFLPTIDRSRCSQQVESLVWRNQPDRPETVQLPADTWDEQLTDPALLRAVRTQGTAELEWTARGSYVVEIFLTEQAAKPSSFVLMANGQAVDRRLEIRPGPERLMPGGRSRYLSLVALIQAPARLEVATGSAGWALAGVRWTERQEFETMRVSALRRQLKRRLAEPFFGIGERGASLRAAHIEQLGLRLQESRNIAARREGLHAQARALYWRAAENHEPREVTRAAELIADLVRTVPDDDLIRQMASAGCRRQNSPRDRIGGAYCDSVAAVPWSIDLPPDPEGAPAWARVQRRLMRRMEAITGWWVDRRQRDNGELGGGWGDDVEILRQWGPQALGFGSETAARGIRRLADGLWNSDEILDGYNRRVTDVEHSSEPTTDTAPLRAALDPRDPEALDRLARISACAYNWISPGGDGRWRFQSSWFNCRTLDQRPERKLDVHLNTRAMGPALWHAYLSRDAKIVDLLEKWGASWRRAQDQTEHGKPAGTFPPVIDSDTGEYLIRSTDWAKPQAEWDYFQWSPGSQDSLSALMGALFDLTGNPDWAAAAKAGYAALAPSAFPSEAGEVLALMASEGAVAEERMSVNFDMFTSEALWTDRVYYPLPANYQRGLFGGEAPRGDRYPQFAVTWLPAGGDIARAVLGATPERLSLALYNFESQAVELPLRFWRLKAGRYRVEGLPGGPVFFTVGARPQDWKVNVPARTDTRLEIVFAGL